MLLSFQLVTRNLCFTISLILGVDNSSSFHSDNRKNNFLILGKGPTLELMEVLVHQRKKIVLTLMKQIQKFASVYIIMLIIVVCLLMENKSLSLKPTIKILTFLLDFV